MKLRRLCEEPTGRAEIPCMKDAEYQDVNEKWYCHEHSGDILLLRYVTEQGFRRVKERHEVDRKTD